MPAVTETGFDAHFLVHFRVESKAAKVFTVTQRYKVVGVTPTVSNMPEFATQIAAIHGSFFSNCLIEDCWYRGVHLRYMNGATQLESYSESGQDVTGTADGDDVLPEEDCVVIRKRTGKAGRSHRGRIFMPLVPENFADDSRLTIDGQGVYKSLAYKFKEVHTLTDSLSAAIITPVHASFKTGELDTIVETGIVLDVLNRRDRRDPKGLLYTPTPP